MFKYGKGTYIMLLSVADRGETIKDEREREREKESERGIMMMVHVMVEIIRGHWPMFNRTMLSLHVSSLSILKMIKDPLISLHILHNNNHNTFTKSFSVVTYRIIIIFLLLM